MLSHIETQGGCWLLPADDPILADVDMPDMIPRRWRIVLTSSIVRASGGRTQHLTYGIVVSAIDGWNQLINSLLGCCVVNLDIEDSDWGRVGTINMLPLLSNNTE